jgi:hypothetical protein
LRTCSGYARRHPMWRGCLYPSPALPTRGEGIPAVAGTATTSPPSTNWQAPHRGPLCPDQLGNHHKPRADRTSLSEAGSLVGEPLAAPAVASLGLFGSTDRYPGKHQTQRGVTVPRMTLISELGSWPEPHPRSSFRSCGSKYEDAVFRSALHFALAVASRFAHGNVAPTALGLHSRYRPTPA